MLEIKKEELYFFIDISTSFLKKKILLKGLKEFIEKKKKINILLNVLKTMEFII